MKDSLFCVLVVGCVLSACVVLAVLFPTPEPNISIVQKTYTLQWHGNDTILTVVYPTENVTIPVVHGENFVVNGTAMIYDSNNNYVARLP